MPGNLRTFVALALADGDAAALAAWGAEALAGVPDLRPVAAANLHATLVFCGMLQEPERAEVARLTVAEATGVALPALVPRRLAVLGSVVAVVYEPVADAAPLLALQARLAARLADAGLASREDRPWLPHVTVARARRGVRPRPGRLDPPGATISPSGVAAYTSVPMQGGVSYRPVAFIEHDADTRAHAAPDGGG
jgi:2'-5' RNA ligase